MVGNVVAFRVHAPCSGALLLDIFANAVTPQEYLTGEPMKFKSVCKFKIVCEDLQTVMVPLPDCASGEWGPAKATRLFGLIPVSHEDALVFAHKSDLGKTEKSNWFSSIIELVMGRTPFYRTSNELEHHFRTSNELEHHFSNIEQTRTYSSENSRTSNKYQMNFKYSNWSENVLYGCKVSVTFFKLWNEINTVWSR